MGPDQVVKVEGGQRDSLGMTKGGQRDSTIHSEGLGRGKDLKDTSRVQKGRWAQVRRLLKRVGVGVSFLT